MKKKVGLFFGTFNPIHVGHLVIGNHVVEYTDMDEVWFVVSPHNPLKEKSTLLADHHRLQLVRIAVEDNPKLKASNVEFDLPRPSYTVDTLVYLTEKYPDLEFSLIMGEDNLRTLHKWKNWEVLLNNHVILVYPRAKVESEKDSVSKTAVAQEYEGARIQVLDAPVMNISATFIRRSIRNGKDVRYLLTPVVEEYVREMHFYEK